MTPEYIAESEQIYRAARLKLILRRRDMNKLARGLGYRNYAEYCND